MPKTYDTVTKGYLTQTKREKCYVRNQLGESKAYLLTKDQIKAFEKRGLKVTATPEA